MDNLELLFSRRFHGASSLNGFYYQILYSIYKSFEVFKIPDASMTLEGIEDIDVEPSLKGSETQSQYIQVKFRKDKLNWTEFIDILKSFTKTYEVDKQKRFLIATSNGVAESINEFIIHQAKRNKTKKKLRESVTTSLTNDDLHNLMNAIDFDNVSLEDIKDYCIKTIVKQHDCLERSADLILTRLIVEYTEIATKRGSITRDKFDSFCIEILETFASEEYNAYGQGLIERVSWDIIGNPSRFYEGKNVLSGDIAQDLDVKRTTWLDEISNILRHNSLAVIKAPSGQGKSALMYRYAKDYGTPETTFVVYRIDSEVEVTNIVKYLTAISKLSSPIMILIDDLNYNHRQWSILVSKCQHINVHFLITVREENWYLYSKYTEVDFEIVSPTLELQEAIDIYTNLASKNRIIKHSITAIEYFEMLGEPKLLIEYIFLLTQGNMLINRLKDQITALNGVPNSATKIKLLRYISVADVAGVELSFEQVKSLISPHNDIQQTIESLQDEYITIENGVVKGLHTVRSRHIKSILHDSILTIKDTVKDLFIIVDNEQLNKLIRSILINEDISYQDFLEGFNLLILQSSLSRINNLLEAIYTVGLNNYITHNLIMINEAYELLGFTALFLLSYEIVTTTINNDVGDSLFNQFPTQGYFPQLQEIRLMEIKAESGKEFVQRLIKKISPHINLSNIKDTGLFLDWCSFTSSKISGWEKFKNSFIFSISFDGLKLEDLCQYTLGLYRYDPEIYFKFMELNQTVLIDYLKYNLDCYQIDLKQDYITISFITLLSEDRDTSNQAVKRLEVLYQLFPYLKHYNSEPYDNFTDDIKPSHTNNCKHMLPRYLQPIYVTNRNVSFLSYMYKLKIPQTSHIVQNYWVQLRTMTLEFVNIYYKTLIFEYTGINNLKDGEDSNHLSTLIHGISQMLTQVPYLMNINHDIVPLNKILTILMFNPELNSWGSSIGNFFNQLVDYLNGETSAIKLCMVNLKNSISILPKVQEIHRVYCNSISSNINSDVAIANEAIVYSRLYDLMEIKFILQIKPPLTNPIAFLSKLRVKEKDDAIQDIRNLFIASNGINVPDDYLIKDGLKFVPVLYECSEPSNSFKEMFEIIDILYKSDKDYFAGFWIIPLYNRFRFHNQGYLIYTHTIKQIIENPEEIKWEWLAPLEIPNELLAIIPQFSEIREDAGYQQMASSEGLKFVGEMKQNLISIVNSLPEEHKYERMLKEKYLKQIETMFDKPE